MTTSDIHKVNGLTRRGFLALGGGVAAGCALTTGFEAYAASSPGLKTVEDGVITIAMSGTMPMTGFKDGSIMGSDAEMIVAIAKRLGLGVKPALMSWSATIEAIKTGRADIMCGNMSWTPKRADAVLLTDAIYYAGYFLLMKQDMPFTESIGVEDIKGHSIGTGVGYSLVSDLKKLPDIGEVKLYDKDDGAIRDVAAGRLDFAVLDAMEVDYVLLKNPDLKLKQVPLRQSESFPLLTEKGVTVMGMSLENKELFDAINAGVSWLWKSKTNAEVLSRNGMSNPDYLVAPKKNPRLGIDRDESGNILGPGAHTPKDYSNLFG